MTLNFLIAQVMVFRSDKIQKVNSAQFCVHDFFHK